MSLQDTGIKGNECANCHKPIILAWCGKQGMYCSNVCYEVAELSPPLADSTDEKENLNVSKKKSAVSSAVPEKTVSPAKSKSAESKAAKKPEAKAAAPAKKPGKAGAYPDTAVIHMAEKDIDASRSERLRTVLKNKMTIGEYKAAMVKAKYPVDLWSLKEEVKRGKAKIA